MPNPLHEQREPRAYDCRAGVNIEAQPNRRADYGP
jgi:hypothetical protein